MIIINMVGQCQNIYHMAVYHLKNETPFKKKILNTSERSPKGYIVEVDLELLSTYTIISNSIKTFLNL